MDETPPDEQPPRKIKMKIPVSECRHRYMFERNLRVETRIIGDYGENCPVSSYSGLTRQSQLAADYFLVSIKDKMLMTTKLNEAKTIAEEYEVLATYYKRYAFYSSTNSPILLRGFILPTTDSPDTKSFVFLLREVIQTMIIAVERDKMMTPENHKMLCWFAQMDKDTHSHIIQTLSLDDVEDLADTLNVNKEHILIVEDFSIHSSGVIFDLGGSYIRNIRDAQQIVFMNLICKTAYKEGDKYAERVRSNALALIEIFQKIDATFFYYGAHMQKMVDLILDNRVELTDEFFFYSEDIKYNEKGLIPTAKYAEVCVKKNIPIYENSKFLEGSPLEIDPMLARMLCFFGFVEKYFPNNLELRWAVVSRWKYRGASKYLSVLEEEFFERWSELDPWVGPVPLPPEDTTAETRKTGNVRQRLAKRRDEGFKSMIEFTSLFEKFETNVKKRKNQDSYQWIAENSETFAFITDFDELSKQQTGTKTGIIIKKLSENDDGTYRNEIDSADLSEATIETEAENMAEDFGKSSKTDDKTNKNGTGQAQIKSKTENIIEDIKKITLATIETIDDVLSSSNKIETVKIGERRRQNGSGLLPKRGQKMIKNSQLLRTFKTAGKKEAREGNSKAENKDEQQLEGKTTAKQRIPISICSLDHDHDDNEHNDCPVSTYKGLKENDLIGAEYFFVYKRDANRMLTKFRESQTPEEKIEVLEKYYNRFQFYSRTDSPILLRGFLHRTEESNDSALFAFLPLEVIETVKITLNRQKKLTSQIRAKIERYEELMKYDNADVENHIVPTLSLAAVEAIADEFNVDKNLIRIIRDFSYDKYAQIIDLSGNYLVNTRDVQSVVFRKLICSIRSIDGSDEVDDVRMNALNLMKILMQTNYIFLFTHDSRISTMNTRAGGHSVYYGEDQDFRKYNTKDLMPVTNYFEVCRRNEIQIYRNPKLLKSSQSKILVDFASTLCYIGFIEKYIPNCFQLRKNIFNNLKFEHADTPADFWPILKEEFLDKWEKLDTSPQPASNAPNMNVPKINCASSDFKRAKNMTLLTILSQQWKIAVNHSSTLLLEWKKHSHDPKKFRLSDIDVARPKTIFFATDPPEFFVPQIEKEDENNDVEKPSAIDDEVSQIDKNMPSTSEERVVLKKEECRSRSGCNLLPKKDLMNLQLWRDKNTVANHPRMQKEQEKNSGIDTWKEKMKALKEKNATNS